MCHADAEAKSVSVLSFLARAKAKIGPKHVTLNDYGWNLGEMSACPKEAF